LPEKKAVSDGVHLPRQGPGSRAVRLLLLSTVAASLLVGAAALHALVPHHRRVADEAHAEVLKASAEQLRLRVERGLAEAERIARQEALWAWVAGMASETPAGAAEAAALERELGQALAGSQFFSGVVVLDREGRTQAAAGSGPAFEALIASLATKSAVDGELLDAMQAANLRRELGSVEEASLHVVDAAGVDSTPIASAPLRGAAGRPAGSLHALLRGAELGAQLRAELLAGGRVVLMDAAGHVLAAAGEGAGASQEVGPSDAPSGSALPLPGFLAPVTRSHPVGLLGWTLVSEQPALDAYRPLALASIRMAAAAAFAVVLAGILGIRASRRSARSLQALFDGVRRVARADFPVQLPEAKLDGQLEAVFRAFNAMAERLAERHLQLEESVRAFQGQNQAFQKQHDVLSRLSITDGLTELHNHRYLQEQLAREIKRLARTGKGLSMLIIDIDDFKQLNDRYGHAAGDEFLRQLARILRESVRDTDLLARYGGEEFVILTTGTDLAGATVLAEKLRMKVSETSFIVDSSMRPRRMTVSIGVAEYKRSRTEFFTAADAALYRAKAAGKDCVVTADPAEGDA
jgi:diguanylate cyclase (GGDEF)-like protein